MKKTICLLIIVTLLLACSKDETKINYKGIYITNMRNHTIDNDIIYEQNEEINFSYNADNQLIRINRVQDSGFDLFDFDYKITYDSKGRVIGLNKSKYIYNVDGYTKVSEADSTEIFEKFYQLDEDCIREIYVHDVNHNIIDTLFTNYKFDMYGNIIELENISNASVAVVGINENYGSGVYSYDTKTNKYWNIPDEIKYRLGVNPGNNNVIKHTSSSGYFILNEILYNDDDLPFYIKKQNFKIENLDTILISETETEIEYIKL